MKHVISEIITHGSAVKEFRLRRQDHAPLPAWQPGSHIVLRFAGSDGTQYENHYSLVGEPAAGDAYRIAVLRLGDGKGGSRCLHDEMAPGMEIDVTGPFDSFPLAPEPGSIMLIAGGIGITPMVSMAHALGARGIPFELHYLAHSAQRLVLLEELRAIPNANIVLHVSEESGRTDLDAMLGAHADGATFYACGPVPLLQALERSGTRLGWPVKAMHFESFGARVQESDEPLTVELAMSQMTVTVQPGTSILDALIAADVFVSYECKRGECANCYTQVLEGKPVHRDVILTQEQRAVGMCTCVSWASGGRLVLDL
jgi:vanillate O-demethylase ferredoxin subunit